MTLGFVVVQLDVTVVNVATKAIGSSMGGNISSLQWVVNAYTLAFAALILTAGALGDRIGAKRVFVAGFAIFTIASLGCGFAPSLIFLVASRIVQGLGASILVPCSLALLNHTYNNEGERTRAVGIWAAGASAALAAGPIIGGALISFLGWRSIFFINLPLGILGIWLTIKYTTETTRSSSRGIDLWGQLTAIAGLALLAASMIEGGNEGWTNTFVLCGFAAFVIFAALFIYIEKRKQNPMLPLSLFENKTFGATTAIGFLINVSFYGLIFIISLYLQQIRSYSPLQTGLAFLPMMIAVLIANLSAGRLSKRLGAKWLIIIGEIIFGTGCIFLITIDPHSPYIQMAFQLAAMGFGVGLIVPPMTSSLLGSVDKSRSGIASGVLNSMRQAGSVIGVALFGSMIGNNKHFVIGLHISLLISTGLLLLSILSTLRMDGKKRS